MSEIAEGGDPDTDLIRQLITRKDDTIAGEVSGQTGEGESIEGFAGQHGNFQYVAFTSSDWEHITIQFQLNVDQYYYAIEMEGADEGEEVEADQSDLQEARRNLEKELQDQPTAPKVELRLNLKQILGREGCSVNFDTGADPFNIHGYEVTRKVFARDGQFEMNDFELAVQNVINFGWTGKDLILDYYGLQPGVDSGSPGY